MKAVTITGCLLLICSGLIYWLLTATSFNSTDLQPVDLPAKQPLKTGQAAQQTRTGTQANEHKPTTNPVTDGTLSPKP